MYRTKEGCNNYEASDPIITNILELEVTPKKRDTHKEEVNRETQLLTQDHSATFTTPNIQTTPQKINANSPYICHNF